MEMMCSMLCVGSICGEMSGDEGILQSSKESVKLQGDEKIDSHKKVSGRKKKGPLHIIISMYNM